MCRWWLVVVLALAGTRVLRAAVQTAIESEPGFAKSTEYTYSYDSAASLLENLNMSVHGEVSAAVIFSDMLLHVSASRDNEHNVGFLGQLPPLCHRRHYSTYGDTSLRPHYVPYG